MQLIPGIIYKGHIEPLQSIPAEDNTSVLIFILPKPAEVTGSQDLFGKWDWFTNEMEEETRDAWQGWTNTTSSL